MAEPSGYSLYKFVHNLRWGKKVVKLTPRSYKQDPLRAMEIAVGVKPKKVITDLRKRKDPAKMGRINR